MSLKILYIGVSLWLLWSSVEDIAKGHITRGSIGMGGLLVIISFFVPSELSYLQRLCGLLMGLFFFCVHWITKNGIGIGDVIIVSILGVLVGFMHVTGVVLLSLFLSALFSMGILIIKKVKKTYEFPYIPFILLSWMGSLLL